MNAQISCLSKISQVTVHARGALVRRQVVVPADEALPAGDCDLMIDITPLAEPGSVRAAIPPGSAPATAPGNPAGPPAGPLRSIIAVQSALIVPAVAIPQGPSEARVHELVANLSRLDLAIARLQTQRQSLMAVQPNPALRTTSLIEKIDERMAEALLTAQLLGTVQGDLDRRLQELVVERTQTQRELEAVRLQRSQDSTEQSPDSARRQRRVTVRLGGGGALPQLEVVYVVPAARFWPIYTLRITEGGRKATWLIEALCAQRSGEDWRDVRLALSTADLIYDARLPELPSLRLGRVQPAPRRGYRPPPEGLERMFGGYDRAFIALPAPEPMPADVDDEVGSSSGVYKDGVAFPESFDEGGPSQGYPETARSLNAVARRDQAPDLRKKSVLPSKSASLLRSRAASGEGAAMAQPSMPPPSMSFAPGGRGGAAGAPMAPPSVGAAHGAMAKAAPMRFGSSLGGGGGGGMPSDEESDDAALEAELHSEPQDAWLDFDHLIMAGAGDAQRRGRLTYSAEGDAGQRQANAQLEMLTPNELVADPQTSRGRFDHRFDADGLVVIPADGQPHRVALLAAETPPAMRMLTVPRERPEVYREAEFQNPCEAPLLSGPVDVYVEGSLLTTARIAHIDRGGTLRVGMGVEDRLRVARNVRSDEDTTGLLGGTMVVTHTVTIELSSALSQSCTVEVLERLPVTEDKSVLIEFVAARPESTSYTQAERGAPIRGGLQWRVPIAAAGKAKIEYQYRITFPAKTEIVGGNRRD